MHRFTRIWANEYRSVCTYKIRSSAKSDLTFQYPSQPTADNTYYDLPGKYTISTISANRSSIRSAWLSVNQNYNMLSNNFIMYEVTNQQCEMEKKGKGLTRWKQNWHSWISLKDRYILNLNGTTFDFVISELPFLVHLMLLFTCCHVPGGVADRCKFLRLWYPAIPSSIECRISELWILRLFIPLGKTVHWESYSGYYYLRSTTHCR